MQLVRIYLKQRWRGIAVSLVFYLIFFVCFFLYKLPLEAIVYPLILCVALGTLILILDFRRIQKKHQMLQSIHSFTDDLTTRFPTIESMEDADYQQIIRDLQKEQYRFLTDAGKKYTDMVDYYTLWAHQIKTPIASMRLSMQNEDSPLTRNLLADLFRIEQYVEMVLVFLRLDSESTDYLFRSYQVDPMIRQVVRKFANEFIQRKITLDYESIEASVITDEKWFSFVLEQVLSNALKYTPQGTIRIYMEDPKTLCIQDTGVGISKEDIPRIFEKGFTGYQGRVDKRASGIGLYLSKRICQNLGHTIEVTSELDVGTTVRIDLSQYNLQAE